MAGIEVSANLLANLRNGTGVRAVTPAAAGVISASLVVLLMAALRASEARRGLWLALGAALAMPALSLALLAFDVWFAPAAFALTSLLAYPFWAWRRLEAAGRFFDEESARIAAVEPAAIAALDPPAEAAASFADATERRIALLRRAGDTARRAHRLLTETVAALPEAVFVASSDGIVRLANHRAAALASAVDARALIGQRLVDCLAALEAADAPDWAALLERAAAAGSLATDARERGAAGTHDTLVRLVSLRDERGTPQWLIVSCVDLSALRSAQRQRDRLLAFVSHDLRAPQASLVSLVQLQREGILSTPQAELLNQVEELARRTLTLADEFVRIAQAQEKPLEIETLDLAAVARQALDEAAPLAAAKALHVAFDPPAGSHAARGEHELVLRAVGNLLSNAIKFSPQGATVRVDVVARAGEYGLAVADQGPGIAAADLALLFKRFQRAGDADWRASTPGIGLGLAFVDMVAQRLGGSVDVATAPGQGARFVLWLPAADRTS
jgi:signal transduction histidine kinase